MCILDVLTLNFQDMDFMDVNPSLDTVQEVVLMFGIGKTIWLLVQILLQDTLTATPSVATVQEPEEQVAMKKICILMI